MHDSAEWQMARGKMANGAGVVVHAGFSQLTYLTHLTLLT
jgi:hypothetical protein